MEFCLHCFRPNRPSPTSGHQSYATRLPLASSSVSYDVQRRNLVFHHLRNSIKGQRTNFGNNRFFVLCSKNRFGRNSEQCLWSLWIPNSARERSACRRVKWTVVTDKVRVLSIQLALDTEDVVSRSRGRGRAGILATSGLCEVTGHNEPLLLPPTRFRKGPGGREEIIFAQLMRCLGYNQTFWFRLKIFTQWQSFYFILYIYKFFINIVHLRTLLW